MMMQSRVKPYLKKVIQISEHLNEVKEKLVSMEDKLNVRYKLHQK